MIKTDVIVIGAGLLGCFTARNLTRYKADVIVLEKEADVCRGISKANTGIVYSGYNNSPDSVKQKLCVQANEEFDELCCELEVPFSRPGSLMIGYGPKADETIAKKYRNGVKGGVKGLRMLSGSEAEAMEPALAPGITSALYAPTTGTVDPWDLCIAAYENARDNGAQFVFNSPVTAIKRDGDGFIVETDRARYFAGSVVNAAGLYSDTVREMSEKPAIRLFPKPGDYIVLDKSTGDTVSRIIFHQDEEGKGLTLVPTVDGNLLVGPTKRKASGKNDLPPDMRTEREGLDYLNKLCERVVPGLDMSQQIRTFGAMRPDPFPVELHDGKYVKAEEHIKDIQITEDDGMFSLIGIKTPGLTFSNELGRIVADKAAAYAGITEINEQFDPHRKAIVRARDLCAEERAELIKEDPDYGEVVCFCMDVTKAEVLQAAARGARDFESVKRRTGAGLGKCQGSRCRRRIMDIIRTEI